MLVGVLVVGALSAYPPRAEAPIWRTRLIETGFRRRRAARRDCRPRAVPHDHGERLATAADVHLRNELPRVAAPRNDSAKLTEQRVAELARGDVRHGA